MVSLPRFLLQPYSDNVCETTDHLQGWTAGHLHGWTGQRRSGSLGWWGGRQSYSSQDAISPPRYKIMMVIMVTMMSISVFPHLCKRLWRSLWWRWLWCSSPPCLLCIHPRPAAQAVGEDSYSGRLPEIIEITWASANIVFNTRASAYVVFNTRALAYIVLILGIVQ